MKKTLLTVIATAALAPVLLADTKETPRGGSYDMRFSQHEERLGSFINKKVIFSLPDSKNGKIHHSRKALLVEKRYMIFLENSSTSGIHWQGENKEMPIFLPFCITMMPFRVTLLKKVIQKEPPCRLQRPL